MVDLIKTVDLRLYNDRCMNVVGPSQSGKTTFVKSVIINRELLFHSVPKRVLWYYGIYQANLHNELRYQHHVHTQQGLPNAADIKKGDLIILDDLMQESQLSKNISSIFTRLAHHQSFFVIFISQNIYLFASGKEYRTQSLNTHYFVLFKNPRDKSQIQFLARQVEPNKSKSVIDVYHSATSRPHGYLFVDLTQECPDEYRFRTNILPYDSQPMIIFNI